MPPPGVFQRLDLYCRRRWRRVRHLANEFWSPWRKEFLTTIQARSNDIKKQRNFQVGDIVQLIEPDLFRNVWSMARLSDVRWNDKKECASSVTMLMANLDPVGKRRLLDRPITKLVLLVESELVDKDWESEVYKCLQLRFMLGIKTFCVYLYALIIQLLGDIRSKSCCQIIFFQGKGIQL